MPLSRPLFLLFLLLAGCSGDWGQVEGNATIDGRPLETGNVAFHPVAGGPTAYGSIVADGRFKLATGDRAGLKSGEYVVTVSSLTIPEDGKGQTAKLLTPAQYARPETSPLRVTIRPGANAIALPLKSS